MKTTNFPVCCGAYFFYDINPKDIKDMEGSISVKKVPMIEAYPTLAYRITSLTNEEDKMYGPTLLKMGFKCLACAGKGRDTKFLYSWNRL